MQVAMKIMMTGILCAGALSGCVSKSAYDQQVEQNEHLRYVKTEQDIERDGLTSDVQALRRAYSQHSLRVTGLESTVQQALVDMKALQARLTTVSQELALQRVEFGKFTGQAQETLELLRTMSEQQQAMNGTISGLGAKVEVLRKQALAVAKLSRPAETTDTNKQEVGSESDGKGKGKGAAERALEQKLGQAPTVVPPSKAFSAKSEPSPVTSAPVTTGSPHITGSVGENPSVVVPPTVSQAPIVPTAPVTRTEGAGTGPKDGAVAGAVAVKPDEVIPAPTTSAQVTDSGGQSPLLTPSAGEVKPTTKQSWTDWAKEKIGWKKPVQTASQTAGVGEKP